MKTIKKQINSIALILSVLILLQGCTVYKSVPVSLEQAANSETKVKVLTNSNEKLIFKRIGVENGSYYGVKKVKRNMVKIPLDKKMLNKINVKDKTMSIILSVGIPIALLLGAGFVFDNNFY